MRLPAALMRDGAMTRQMLVIFTIISAMINGLVTASVGAWLAQKYSATQTRRQSINAISTLFYERRIKGGMVVSAIRRNADIEELRYRKRSYDETFVDWNKNIRQNLFAIREVLGEKGSTTLEQDFEDLLVNPLSQIDACLTKAYDAKVTGQDARPLLEACKMAELYQGVLDCGASFTNELYRMTRLSFVPFMSVGVTERSLARARVVKGCAQKPAT
jgi:hypothetical protein